MAVYTDAGLTVPGYTRHYGGASVRDGVVNTGPLNGSNLSVWRFPITWTQQSLNAVDSQEIDRGIYRRDIARGANLTIRNTQNAASGDDYVAGIQKFFLNLTSRAARLRL